jgi:hypothetical protein
MEIENRYRNPPANVAKIPHEKTSTYRGCEKSPGFIAGVFFFSSHIQPMFKAY